MFSEKVAPLYCSALLELVGNNVDGCVIFRLFIRLYPRIGAFEDAFPFFVWLLLSVFGSRSPFPYYPFVCSKLYVSLGIVKFNG